MPLYLNLGCGGEVIRRKHWKNYDLFPVDPIVEKIDITKLPEQNNTVKIIVASHCLEHFENPKAVLEEWWRVLAVNGVLYIAVPDNERRDEWIGQHLKTVQDRHANKDLEDHHVDFTPASLKELIFEVTGQFPDFIDPNYFWFLPGKANWQIVVRIEKKNATPTREVPQTSLFSFVGAAKPVKPNPSTNNWRMAIQKVLGSTLWIDDIEACAKAFHELDEEKKETPNAV